jgi:multidrug efflux pump subunit AcrA (membrane-fusion protein)
MTSRNTFTLPAVALTFAALSLLTSACGRSAESKNKQAAAANATPEAVQVSTAAAITRELPRYTEATGSLAAAEQTDVAPTVAGRVVAVGVDLGSYVQRGAVLARLDDADARLRLTQLQAQAQQALSGVRQAEARIGLRPGQAFDPVRVPEVGAARVALDLAEKQLRRFERLIESGDVSRSAYDQQKAQRDQLQQQYEAALQAARQNYAAIATGARRCRGRRSAGGAGAQGRLRCGGLCPDQRLRGGSPR